MKIHVIVSTLEQKQALFDQGLGLKADNIFWPHGKRTAQQIHDFTSGKGVDVVYSYSNERSTNGCQRCLAAFGRFIELISSGDSKAQNHGLIEFS